MANAFGYRGWSNGRIRAEINSENNSTIDESVLDESQNVEILDPGTNGNYLNASDDNFDNQVI